VWIAALVGAVLVGVFAGDRFLTWIPVVAAAALLLTFVIQLSLQRKEGLVTRISASFGGVLVILGVATVVLILLHPESLGRLFA
jgi:drug/metabolite transporter superfamily protein YnfA